MQLNLSARPGDPFGGRLLRADGGTHEHEQHSTGIGLPSSAGVLIAQAAQDKIDSKNLLVGGPLIGHAMKAGTFRKITVADLPQPYATESVRNNAQIVPRPADAWPQTLPGFKVDQYATGLDGPRQIRVAPNGDFFVAETRAGQIRVFRGLGKDGKPEQVSVFATGLRQPFGVNFYPPGPNPQWLYVGNTSSVVRCPFQTGDLKARGEPQTIIPELPTGGHSTRDVAFSPDGKRMFVAVGSATNVDDPDTNPAEATREHPRAVRWHVRESLWRWYRNPVGLAINPTIEPWCSTNERDLLGDNLCPTT